MKLSFDKSLSNNIIDMVEMHRAINYNIEVNVPVQNKQDFYQELENSVKKT